MDITNLITSVGFPIAACVALGWFIYKSYEHIQKTNERREEKLYTMLGKSQTQLDKLEDTNEKFVWGEYNFARALKREFEKLGYYVKLSIKQLKERYDFQKTALKKQFPLTLYMRTLMSSCLN